MYKTKFLNVFRKLFTIAPFERVLLYFVEGKDHQGLWARLVPNPILYRTGSIRQVNRRGIEYSLDLSCLMHWYVYWGMHEAGRDNLYALVEKGNTVLDVGTNAGETLLNFAKLTSESGCVIGFEPDPENFQAAQKNIALNNFGNVKVFKLGISDKEETLKLYRVDEHNSGMNRVLNKEDDTSHIEFNEIHTTTLDKVVQDNNLSQVDLIKIDIEGYEMHALRGAEETLKRFRPNLFVEVGYSRLIKNGTSPNEMFKFLEVFGYRIYHGETLEILSSDADYSYFGDGGIDILARYEDAA